MHLIAAQFPSFKKPTDDRCGKTRHALVWLGKVIQHFAYHRFKVSEALNAPVVCLHYEASRRSFANVR
jgi:hypothetical protein